MWKGSFPGRMADKKDEKPKEEAPIVDEGDEFEVWFVLWAPPSKTRYPEKNV